LRHRFHVRRIEFVELLDMRQNLAEILAHARYFVVREPQICQIGDVPDFFFRQIQAVAFWRESLYNFFSTGS
jgi:hypothetical protein